MLLSCVWKGLLNVLIENLAFGDEIQQVGRRTGPLLKDPKVHSDSPGNQEKAWNSYYFFLNCEIKAAITIIFLDCEGQEDKNEITDLK